MAVVKIEAKPDMAKMAGTLGPRSYSVHLGADPEFFLKVGKEILPAFEFAPHKSDPAVVQTSTYPRLSGDGDCGRYTLAYWDGFQAEISMRGFGGVNPAHTCLMIHTSFMFHGMRGLLEIARKKYPKAQLSLSNVVRIKREVMDKTADPFVEFGCEPSFNLYGLKGTWIENPRHLLYRFAGGHMHFGPNEYVKRRTPSTVRALDQILGVWAVGAAQSFDNMIRRKYYGLPGEYRLPSHGLEYRVLSNFYYAHPAIHHAAWEIGRQAFRLGYWTPELAQVWSTTDEETQEAIANCDVALARKILTRNKEMFMWLFALRGWDDSCVTRLFNVGLNGIESEIKDPTDIEGNWRLQQDGLYNQSAGENSEYWEGHCAHTRPISERA